MWTDRSLQQTKLSISRLKYVFGLKYNVIRNWCEENKNQ